MHDARELIQSGPESGAGRPAAVSRATSMRYGLHSSDA